MKRTILTTERLILRIADDSDTHFIYNLLNSPKWLQYIGDRGIKSLDDAGDYINNKLVRSYAENGYGLYVMVLKDSKIPIGICGFVKRDYLDEVDIGFAIQEDYERNGFTYEAAIATLKYAETVLNFNKVYAITSKDNIASQNLLKKLGFEFTSYINEPVSNEEISLFTREILESISTLKPH
jgi:RimJ/RimL family protein N-acetyltransferase